MRAPASGGGTASRSAGSSSARIAAGSGSSQGRATWRGAPAQRARTAVASDGAEIANWTLVGPAPATSSPRPRAAAGIAAAAALPTTATLSAGSSTRRQIRRVMLASTDSRTTPAGRCVHTTRCSPSERPRAARSENTVWRSGSSATSAANSSTTMTRSRQRCRRQLLDGAGTVRREGLLATAQFGAQAVDGARGRGRVEVADHPDDVREALERREGGAALEVDEQEAEFVGGMIAGECEHPGHEQLALARARGAPDERVRPVADEVEAHRPVLAASDDGGERRARLSRDLLERAERHGRRQFRRPPPSRTPCPLRELARSEARLRRAHQHRPERVDPMRRFDPRGLGARAAQSNPHSPARRVVLVGAEPEQAPVGAAHLPVPGYLHGVRKLPRPGFRRRERARVRPRRGRMPRPAGREPARRPRRALGVRVPRCPPRLVDQNGCIADDRSARPERRDRRERGRGARSASASASSSPDGPLGARVAADR